MLQVREESMTFFVYIHCEKYIFAESLQGSILGELLSYNVCIYSDYSTDDGWCFCFFFEGGFGIAENVH